MPHSKEAARLGFDADNCERMFRAVDDGLCLLHGGCLMAFLLSSRRADWLGHLPGDVRGGVVVALGLIAEALAFSLMAGVDPQVGLYTTACLGIVIAFMGGRTAMISAASGSTALIMALLVRNMGVEYVTVTTLMVGVLQFVGGAFRVNRLIRFVSYPVVMGFVNALGILIFTSQIPTMRHADFAAWGMIVAGVAIIYLLPRLTTIIPSPVVCIMALTAFSLATGHHFQTIGETGRLPNAFPIPLWPHIPSLGTLFAILPYAVGIAIVGLMESMLTSRVVDDLTDTPSDKSRECKGQGIANFLSGIMGGMTGCGIIDQTKINVKFGGRGRLSTFLAGALLLFMVVVLHRWVAAIPVAALVAVMIFAAVTTINWDSLRALRRDPPASTVIMLVTVIVVLATSNLAYGVLAGVCINALLFAGQMHRMLRVDSDGPESGSNIPPASSVQDANAVRFYRVSGPIFFAAADDFTNMFDYTAGPGRVTVDVSKARFWDLTAVNALRQILDKLRRSGKTVLLTGGDSAFASLKRRPHVPHRTERADPASRPETPPHVQDLLDAYGQKPTAPSSLPPSRRELAAPAKQEARPESRDDLKDK